MVGSPPLSLTPPELGLGSEPSHLDLCPSHPALSPCHSIFSIFMNIRHGGHGRSSCGPGMQLWDALPFVSMSVQVLRAGHCSPLQEKLWPHTSLSHSWPQLRPWAPAQLPVVSGPSLGAEGEGQVPNQSWIAGESSLAWPSVPGDCGAAGHPASLDSIAALLSCWLTPAVLPCLPRLPPPTPGGAPGIPPQRSPPVTLEPISGTRLQSLGLPAGPILSRC